MVSRHVTNNFQTALYARRYTPCMWRNGPQILIDSTKITVRHLPLDRPGHQAQLVEIDIHAGGRGVRGVNARRGLLHTETVGAVI